MVCWCAPTPVLGVGLRVRGGERDRGGWGMHRRRTPAPRGGAVSGERVVAGVDSAASGRTAVLMRGVGGVGIRVLHFGFAVQLEREGGWGGRRWGGLGEVGGVGTARGRSAAPGRGCWGVGSRV